MFVEYLFNSTKAKTSCTMNQNVHCQNIPLESRCGMSSGGKRIVRRHEATQCISRNHATWLLIIRVATFSSMAEKFGQDPLGPLGPWRLRLSAINRATVAQSRMCISAYFSADSMTCPRGRLSHRAASLLGPCETVIKCVHITPIFCCESSNCIWRNSSTRNTSWPSWSIPGGVFIRRKSGGLWIDVLLMNTDPWKARSLGYNIPLFDILQDGRGTWRRTVQRFWVDFSSCKSVFPSIIVPAVDSGDKRCQMWTSVTGGYDIKFSLYQGTYVSRAGLWFGSQVIGPPFSVWANGITDF